MRSDERDALLTRRVEAVETIARELGERGDRRRRREREELGERLERLRTAREPFRLFEGSRGLRTLMERFPGFCALWTVAVPSEYVSAVCDRQTRREWPVVRCVCGAATSLERFEPLECRGACARWFLALESSVFVHRFEVEEDAA